MNKMKQKRRLCAFLLSWFLILPAGSWLVTMAGQPRVDVAAAGVAIAWGVLALGWSLRPVRHP